MEWKITADTAKLLGRTAEIDGTLWLSYSASGAEWICRDSECTIVLAGDFQSGDPVHSPRYAVEIDGYRVAEETMGSSRESVHVGCGEDGSVIRVIKLSESADSTMGIAAVICDTKPESTPRKNRTIEFIGDSITCGYGVDGELGDLYRTANEDATKAYAYLTAQAADADYSMVSFSGYGIISGYTESGTRRIDSLVPPVYRTMGDSYGAFADRVKPRDMAWDFAKLQPDLVVVNLGTNDASYCGEDAARQREYIDEYKRFLQTVRACNPGAQILCTLGIMDQRLCGSMEQAAREYREESGDERIATMRFALQDMENDGIAVDWHPSVVTHKKAAEQLTAFLFDRYFGKE